jgi:hypothetical protein
MRIDHKADNRFQTVHWSAVDYKIGETDFMQLGIASANLASPLVRIGSAIRFFVIMPRSPVTSIRIV